MVTLQVAVSGVYALLRRTVVIYALLRRLRRTGEGPLLISITTLLCSVTITVTFGHFSLNNGQKYVIFMQI